MEPWSAGGLSLDYCVACRGLWFDQGELRQHLAKAHAQLADHEVQRTGETRFSCPRCAGTRLAQATAWSVALDVCPRCRGIFLDLGEVSELIGAIGRGEYAGNPAVAGFDNLALGLYIGAGLGSRG
jgi:Zn-finger nucleic acid-binding protein